MDHWKGKVALVTGASAGIGLEIARSLAKNGMRVIAIATRFWKLQELARNIKHEYNIDIYPMACDLRHEEDILKTFKWAFDTFSGIDVLINNAAVAFNKKFHETSTDVYEDVLDVNIMGATVCLREFVKYMEGRKTPAHIINIGCWTSVCPELFCLPMNMYCGSKAAFRIFSENISNELKEKNLDIKVSIIHAAEVLTALHYKFASPTANIPYLHPKDIAEIVISILDLPETVQVKEVLVRGLKLYSDSRWHMR